MTRTQKSLKNISFGILYQFVSVLSSFICRTTLIRFLGNEAVSLNGLFWEIVSMLSLAELGIGIAIVYNLYGPLAQNDIERIKKIMRFFQQCYTAIFFIVLFAGSILTAIIPIFVNGLSYSDSYLRCVFFLYVIQSAISYSFVSKTILLQADQKRYKTLMIQIIFKILQTLFTVLILLSTKNFIAYLGTMIISTFLTNIVATIQASREYPYLKESCEPLSKKERKKILVNVKDIFVKKIAGYVTNSTDNILVSLITGTWWVGLLSNYSMLFNTVKQLENQISGGFAASMGDLAAKESSEYIDHILNGTTFLFQIFGSVLSAGLMACATTFVTIWIGEEYILPEYVVLICCVNSYLTVVKDPLWQTMDACGLFSVDKKLAICSTLINLVTSIILGILYGMVGIFIGTALSTVFEIIGKSWSVYRIRLKRSVKDYSIRWLKMEFCQMVIFILCLTVSRIAIPNLYLRFIVQGVLAVLIAVFVNGIFFFSELKILAKTLERRLSCIKKTRRDG